MIWHGTDARPMHRTIPGLLEKQTQFSAHLYDLALYDNMKRRGLRKEDLYVQSSSLSPQSGNHADSIPNLARPPNINMAPGPLAFIGFIA